MKPITVLVARLRWLATLALVPFLLAVGVRPAHAASPACADQRRVAVEIASELGDQGDDAAMLEYLQDRLPERLAADGLCVDPLAPRRVVVTVAWSDAAHGDYAIALRAIALRATLPEAEPFEPSAVDCPECATVEVLDTIATQVPVALAGLASAAEPGPVLDPSSAPAPPPISPAARPSTHDRARLHRLGHAGIGLAATGVVGIVTGAALWAEHSVVHPADSSYRLALRPAGITLVVTGVLATAAGGTMIAVDLRRGGRRFTLAPVGGRTHAGVAITGRF